MLPRPKTSLNQGLESTEWALKGNIDLVADDSHGSVTNDFPSILRKPNRTVRTIGCFETPKV